MAIVDWAYIESTDDSLKTYINGERDKAMRIALQFCGSIFIIIGSLLGIAATIVALAL